MEYWVIDMGGYTYNLGLPDFGKSFKIIVEPGFPHEFDHAEFNGAQKNQIQKYLGVAILNWKFGFSHIFS